MNAKPTPLIWILRENIDPADSKNDNESMNLDLTFEKASFFHECEANAVDMNLTGINRPRTFRKWQRWATSMIPPFKKHDFSNECEANTAHMNPTGENRPRRFRKWQREHPLRFQIKKSVIFPWMRSQRRSYESYGRTSAPRDSENDNESIH